MSIDECDFRMWVPPHERVQTPSPVRRHLIAPEPERENLPSHGPGVVPVCSVETPEAVEGPLPVTPDVPLRIKRVIPQVVIPAIHSVEDVSRNRFRMPFGQPQSVFCTPQSVDGAHAPPTTDPLERFSTTDQRGSRCQERPPLMSRRWKAGAQTSS